MTDDAVFKARDELTGAKGEVVIFGGATGKGGAVFFAGEVDNDFIFSCGGTLDYGFFAVGTGDTVKHLLDLGVADGDFGWFGFELMDVAEFDLGEDFHTGDVFKGLLRDELGDVDAGRGEGEEFGLVKGAHQGAANGLVQGLAAEVVGGDGALGKGERGFALAEAGEFNSLGEAAQGGVAGRLEVGAVKGHREFNLGVG